RVVAESSAVAEDLDRGAGAQPGAGAAADDVQVVLERGRAEAVARRRQRLGRAPAVDQGVVYLVLGERAIGIERLTTEHVDLPIEEGRGQPTAARGHRRAPLPAIAGRVVDLVGGEIALVAPTAADDVDALIDDRGRQVLADGRQRCATLPHIGQRIVRERYARLVADAADHE